MCKLFQASRNIGYLLPSDPAKCDAWASEDRRSRIVFITRNLPRESVEALFAAVGTLAAPRS